MKSGRRLPVTSRHLDLPVRRQPLFAGPGTPRRLAQAGAFAPPLALGVSTPFAPLRTAGPHLVARPSVEALAAKRAVDLEPLARRTPGEHRLAVRAKRLLGLARSVAGVGRWRVMSLGAVALPRISAGKGVSAVLAEGRFGAVSHPASPVARPEVSSRQTVEVADGARAGWNCGIRTPKAPDRLRLLTRPPARPASRVYGSISARCDASRSRAVRSGWAERTAAR